jgi:arabinogalactan endo-1,4-beta-galactosidase
MRSSSFITNILFALAIVILASCSKGGGTSTTDPVTPVVPPVVPPVDPPVTTTFIKGADISWVTEMEAAGIHFYNAAGTKTECFALMKSLGMNSIRLRVWVNPSNAWCGTADVIAKAVRAKNLGLKVLIDFHYSDSWADPSKQTKPANWASINIASLKTTLASYTTDVLTQLKNAGVTPDWVQIGNETNDGFLWPDAKASTNMANFAQLINAGYDAVKTVFPSAKVIVHISNGWDNSLYRWMFDGLKSNGAKWDVIGMSLYPSYVTGGWQTADPLCLTNMNDMVARYNCEVMIVEVGMPWDSPSDSKLFLQDIITKVKAVTAGKGLGVFYWEPESYNKWQGYTLGAFDNSGKPTVAMDAFAN